MAVMTTSVAKYLGYKALGAITVVVAEAVGKKIVKFVTKEKKDNDVVLIK